MLRCRHKTMKLILKILYIAFSAIGKLTFHESENLTFNEAQDLCQQGGSDLVQDLAFLLTNATWITSTMVEKNMTSAWIGKHLLSLNNGM